MKLFLMLFITTVFNQFCVAQKIDSLTPIRVKASARAVPNPIGNKLNIEVRNFNAGAVKIQIVNAMGNVVYNDKRLVVSAIDNIAIFLQTKPGNYYCTVTQDEKFAKFGFLVAK